MICTICDTFSHLHADLEKCCACFKAACDYQNAGDAERLNVKLQFSTLRETLIVREAELAEAQLLLATIINETITMLARGRSSESVIAHLRAASIDAMGLNGTNKE